MKNLKNAITSKFNGQRRIRSWQNTHFGGMSAVKAHPLAICRFRPNEGGSVVTNLNTKLAPVSGYMRSKAYVRVVQVFVPYQAIEVLELDAQEDAGVTEMTRRRLMAGQGIGLEDEGVITKAANIHPRSVGGDKRLTKTARLAYLAAVNHMRLSAYFNATLVDKTETAILPAVLSANVLNRFNGVLEPETLVDGAINMTGELPVQGINFTGTHVGIANRTGPESGEGADVTYPRSRDTSFSGASSVNFKSDPTNANRPDISVSLDTASELSLRDMVKSKKLDEIVRTFAQYIQDDPINGEEVVERAMYGISVDYDHNCQVLYDNQFALTAQHQRPTDGASINDVSAHFELNEQFATLVPRAELGGQLVTLVSILPVETMQKQPDPAQTEAWELVNRIHDETELDETLLTRADLETEVADVDEDTPAFWVGHNSLKHAYATQGVNDQQVLGVEMKSSMWTYEVPTSVTPENISYPDSGIDMYAFFNWNGAHAEYTIDQRAAITTSLAKGPNPVERIQLFKDDPTLVDND